MKTALTKAYRWVMRNKWRKWGSLAVLSLLLNYTLLLAGVIDGNEFEVITQAILTVVRLFIGL